MGPPLIAAQLLAKQQDASQTSLGDIADLGSGTVLSFTVIGDKDSFMSKFIPKGVDVTIPGYLVILGLVGGVIAAVAAMSAAKTLVEFIRARRQIDRVAGEAFFDKFGPETVEEVLEVRAEERARRQARSFQEWHRDLSQWIRDFREDNDRDPTDDEVGEWMEQNPPPD